MSKAAKAIYAAVVSGLGALVAIFAADVGGDLGFGDVTPAQWLTVALAALLAGGGVYGIRNAA